MSETNELAIVSFKELREMAATMSKSGMFGKSPDQMLSLMLIAQAEGLHPAIAAMEYDVIQSRPALKGQAALARFQQAGGVVNWLVRTDAEAKAEFIPPKGNPLTVSWTMEKAKRMGLAGKDNWNKQPGVMLTWRCVAEGIRAVYPACLNRMYLAEEAQDFEPMRNVTPGVVSSGEPVSVTLLPTSIESPESEPINLEGAGNAKTASDNPSANFKTKAAENAKKIKASGKKDVDEATKDRLWAESNANVAVYWKLICMEQDTILSAPARQEEKNPEGNGDLFGDPIQVLYVELENWIEDTSLPSLIRAEIRATLESGEKNPVKLNALVEKIKQAAGK